jgi:hypothetical protein
MSRAAAPKKSNEAPPRPRSAGREYQELVASLYADPSTKPTDESQQQDR